MRGLFALYALVGLAILFWAESIELILTGLAACLLMVLHEYRIFRHDSCMRLKLDLVRSRIVVERAGQPYFFAKYKVYPTRWFAILRLIDQRQCRTLLLNSDRFNSAQSYRNCRYLLSQLERTRVA